eukprot:4921781-Alexandrium_andersonii.AAC.1
MASAYTAMACSAKYSQTNSARVPWHSQCARSASAYLACCTPARFTPDLDDAPQNARLLYMPGCGPGYVHC